jgi:Xaa-Pro aminopeptidase
MVSGYWPVTAASVALVNVDGRVVLLVPADEEELAQQGWASDVQPFDAGSLDDLRTAAVGMGGTLCAAIRSLKQGLPRIGIERGERIVPAPYVAVHLYGDALEMLLRQFGFDAIVNGADDLLAALRSVKTPGEIERIRVSCRVAADAFDGRIVGLRAGISETEAMADIRRRLFAPKSIDLSRHRADGFAFCMAGSNGYAAFASYQRSTSRLLIPGDLALVHCNSYVDGFWTDITRTYVIGQSADDRQRRMYEAIFEARSSALNAIRPDVCAADVDHAARQVMAGRGFGEAFRHPTGHGVGFAAINHNALPRIHPRSTDVLAEGMTFNVEPGIYIKGYGGMRHCDMVAVTAAGCEVLTPFQCDIAAMTGNAC